MMDFAEGGSDVTTRVARNMKWANFKISKANDKIGVFTSIVSTKIPFKGTSKEYIGADAQEIHDAIKRGVTQCAGQLAKKIQRRRSQNEKENRKRVLEGYVDTVTENLMSILKKEAAIAHEAAIADGGRPAKRPRSAAAGGDGTDTEDEVEGTFSVEES